MRTRIPAASIFCCFFFIMVNTLRSQTIFTESFESTFPPTGWTIINAGTGYPWLQVSGAVYSLSGVKAMQRPSNTSITGNTWAFTPNLNLSTGIYYRISYWYRDLYSPRTEKLKVSIGNAATIAAQTTTLHDYTAITNVPYIEGADTFTVAVNGNYNIGFYCYTDPSIISSLLIDSVVFQQLAPVTCSGTPSIGTIIGPASVCSGVNFTLNLSGNYISSGLSLQWQSSPVSANTFTDIVGANGQSYTTSQTAAKDYRCIVTCSNSGSSVISNIKSVAMRTLCYCIPPASECTIRYIANVKIGFINNSSTCSSNGYTNYYDIVPPTDLAIGTTVPISITPGGDAYNKNFAVWIDYNHNGVFEVSEYQDMGTSPGINNSVVNSSIVVNTNATLGLTMLRLRTKGTGIMLNGSNACTTLSNDNGETEDYLVNIAPMPLCSGLPIGGTTNGTITTICPDINFVLKITGASSGNSGFTYQWQKSLNGTTWTDIIGATSDSLLTSQNAANYYHRKILCTVSGQSAFSTSIQIGINPYTTCYCIPPVADCGSFRYAGIENVLFSNINNTSGCSVNGYIDNTGTVAAANIQAGTYVSMKVKFLSQNTISTKGVTVGIDFNHNGIFDSDESTFASSITEANLGVRIPFNAITGSTRMRVRASYTYEYSVGFCYLDTYGETEDYLVNISPATAPGPNFSFYVNPLATGNGNGLSWANAFTSLMTTLGIVHPADTIRVAKGTYSVSGFPYYFNIKDSVVLLGGYPNSGNPSDALRNWGINQTILNGGGVPVLIRGANAFILDGFILQDTYYDVNTTVSTINITNGVLPKIKHCVFRNNRSPYGVTGIAIRITNSSPQISDCIFINNYGSGSTVFCESNSTTVFTNCIFSKNNAETSVIENNQSTTSIINCNLVSNKTTNGRSLTANNNSVVNVKNTIFYNNESVIYPGVISDYSIDSTEIAFTNSTVSVSNSITQVYDYGNLSLLSKNPKFKDTSSITGPDNFYYTSDDGLQLNNPCSPAMNTGSNASASGITLDIMGNSRIASSIVDIGAYEVQTAPLTIPKTLYVNKSAVGNGSGTSWANAMTELQTAMQSCSDTIRVAAGTYYPSDDNEKKSIWLENKRVILGGYPNTGNPTDAQRNPASNLTILSGEIPNGGGARSDILVRGRTVDSTSITDGIVIKKADVGYNYAKVGGAIYLAINTNPVFRNCTISDNDNYNRGGGLYNTGNSNPRFENSIFENNILTLGSEGGAVVNVNSNPVFLKCIFRNNSTYLGGGGTGTGGAVYNTGSNPVFDSCTFMKNIANNHGAAMQNYYSNPIIRNCLFLGNISSPAQFGGNANDMFNDHSSPQISNTLFSDSTGCNYGGSIANLNQSTPTFTKCEFTNCYANYGGICFNENSSPTFLGCIFRSSIAGTGMIYNSYYSNPLFINCLAYNLKSNDGSFMYSVKSNPVIKNSTFVNNTGYGGLFQGSLFKNTDSTRLTISNSIIWLNSITSNGEIVDPVNTTTPTLMNNCITQTFGTTGINGNLVSVDPIFINISNPAGADNIFFTNDDGLNLVSCSPAMNSGSNASIAGYNSDILSNPRVYNSIVDMGAYEVQALPGLVTNTWTGSVSNIWQNPLNWSLGMLPNPCTKVIINSGTVILNSNATIYNLTVNPGVNISVSTGFNLVILH